MSGTTGKRRSLREQQTFSKDGEQRCRHLRVILLGNSNVGKTSLLCRFVQGTFDDRTEVTITLEALEKEVTVDGGRYLLRVVDTAGHERYKSLRENFYRGTHICLLTFALNDYRSFCDLSMWREEFLYYSDNPSGTEFPFIVIGNKADLKNERRVSDVNAQAWCNANGDVPYFEASAKHALNVEEIFEAAVRRFNELESRKFLTLPGSRSDLRQRGSSVVNLRQTSDPDRKTGSCCT